ncbi:MAG: glutathione S-transferase family protein [Deltaproteobacteria bacterium]|nr:glutathione S-transferase family protein [Deltaproteobacteria bacterium]
MIKLYGVPRSRALRSLWMLEELALPYENVKITPASDTRTPEFLRINPNGHVPVLQEDGLTLCESMAINLYLARKYDKGLWPKTVEDEGRAFQWSVWAMTELEDPIITALRNRVLLPGEQRDAQKADEAAQRFVAPLQVLDGALAGRTYLLSDTFTVADLNVASVLMLAPVASLNLSSAANAQAWLGRCTSRPALTRAQKA